MIPCWYDDQIIRKKSDSGCDAKYTYKKNHKALLARGCIMLNTW